MEKSKLKLPSAKILVLLVLFLVWWAIPSTPAWAKSSSIEIAPMIRQHYESQLQTLSRNKQKHYALRLFRLTGESRYLQPIFTEALLSANRLNSDGVALDDREAIRQRTQTILSHYSKRSRRSRSRKALLAKSGDMAFYLRRLYNLNKLQELGLLKPPYVENVDGEIAALKEVDFRSFLLDEEAIKIYSAQLANDVYYLRDLGIADLEQDYIEAFRRTFDDRRDAMLTPKEYQAKAYGLTHIVIAASGYYQHNIDRHEFEWIFRWFEQNQDRIVRDTKPDVLAEVAICFLLANDRDNAVVDRMKQSLIEVFDWNHHMIPSTTGRFNLSLGEHRNVLALMVFSWPDRLHSGPQAMQFQSLVEKYRRDLFGTQLDSSDRLTSTGLDGESTPDSVPVPASVAVGLR